MSFDVFAQYGRNLAYRGEIEADDSQEAAKQAAYLLGRRIVGVRPAHSEVQPVIVKFKQIPTFV